MFVEAQELAARIGAENVCDFSLGNPAAPVPDRFSRALVDLVEQEDSLTLHGYMNNAGYPDVRDAIAKDLDRRHGLALTADNIIMTVGAAGAINIVMKAVLDPATTWWCSAPILASTAATPANWYANVVEVDPLVPGFQPDLEDLERKLTPRTKLVLINNPCNPTAWCTASRRCGALPPCWNANSRSTATRSISSRTNPTGRSSTTAARCPT